MTTDFSPGGYRILLETLRGQGYEARGYADAAVDHLHLILRHDIDLSLDAALPIAEIERGLSLKAYYFVLLRTELYNVFSAAARRTLSRLGALGHEIGLHLDASLYGNDTGALNKAAAEECAALEGAIGEAVRVISFHRPAKQLLGYPQTLAGRVHTYQPRYFSEMGYCSDSRGAWHHGHPLDHAAVRDRRALQLLTHPIWWAEGGGAPAAKAADFLASRVDMLDRELAENCTVHQPGKARFRAKFDS
jgi:hypothetical protein